MVIIIIQTDGLRTRGFSPFPFSATAAATAEVFIRTERTVPEQAFLVRLVLSAAAAAVVTPLFVADRTQPAVSERFLQVGDVLLDVQQHLPFVRRLGRRFRPGAEQRRGPIPTVIVASAAVRRIFNVKVDRDLCKQTNSKSVVVVLP